MVGKCLNQTVMVGKCLIVVMVRKSLNQTVRGRISLKVGKAWCCRFLGVGSQEVLQGI